MPRATCPSSLLVAASVVVASLAWASPGLAQVPSNVRMLDGALKTRLEFGLKRSPTLRALGAQLEAAPVLVFVDCGARLPGRIGARLNLITSVAGVRYVRVEINCASLGDRVQISLIAHELQHAWEIANRPDILDDDSMQSYFAEYGFQTYYDGSHTAYETRRAIDIQERVLTEIADRSQGDDDSGG
jgi:hypothetical protein